MQVVLGKYDFQIPNSIKSYLTKTVVDKKNILIGGVAGIGKSTLLQQLMLHIPEDSRTLYIDESSGNNQPHLLGGHDFITTIDFTSTVEDLDLPQLLKASMKLDTERIIVDGISNNKAFDIYNVLLTGDTVLATIQSSNIKETTQCFTEKILTKNNETLSREMVDEDLKMLVDVVIHIKSKQSDGRTYFYVSDIVEYQNHKEMVIFRQRL